MNPLISMDVFFCICFLLRRVIVPAYWGFMELFPFCFNQGRVLDFLLCEALGGPPVHESLAPGFAETPHFLAEVYYRAMYLCCVNGQFLLLWTACLPDVVLGL